MPLRQLPQFADLMLLPKVVDPMCVVKIVGDQIRITSELSHELAVMFNNFPNVDVERFSPTEIGLIPVTLDTELILIRWPSGRRIGAALHNGEWFNLMSAASLDSLLSVGVAVTLRDAAPDQDLITALMQPPA